jgi:hypothetical protein
MGGRGHQSTRMTTARRSRSPSSSWSRRSVSIHTSTWIALADVASDTANPLRDRQRAFNRHVDDEDSDHERGERGRFAAAPPAPSLPRHGPPALRPLEASTRDVAQLPVGFRRCSGSRRYGRAIAAVATWGRDRGRRSPHWTTPLDCAPERLRPAERLADPVVRLPGWPRFARLERPVRRRRDAEPPRHLLGRQASPIAIASKQVGEHCHGRTIAVTASRAEPSRREDGECRERPRRVVATRPAARLRARRARRHRSSRLRSSSTCTPLLAG